MTHLQVIRALCRIMEQVGIIQVTIHDVGSNMRVLCIGFVEVVIAGHVFDLHVGRHERFIISIGEANKKIKLHGFSFFPWIVKQQVMKHPRFAFEILHHHRLVTSFLHSVIESNHIGFWVELKPCNWEVLVLSLAKASKASNITHEHFVLTIHLVCTNKTVAIFLVRNLKERSYRLNNQMIIMCIDINQTEVYVSKLKNGAVIMQWTLQFCLLQYVDHTYITSKPGVWLIPP